MLLNPYSKKAVDKYPVHPESTWDLTQDQTNYLVPFHTKYLNDSIQHIGNMTSIRRLHKSNLSFTHDHAAEFIIDWIGGDISGGTVEYFGICRIDKALDANYNDGSYASYRSSSWVTWGELIGNMSGSDTFTLTTWNGSFTTKKRLMCRYLPDRAVIQFYDHNNNMVNITNVTLPWGTHTFHIGYLSNSLQSFPMFQIVSCKTIYQLPTSSSIPDVSMTSQYTGSWFVTSSSQLDDNSAAWKAFNSSLSGHGWRGGETAFYGTNPPDLPYNPTTGLAQSSCTLINHTITTTGTVYGEWLQVRNTQTTFQLSSVRFYTYNLTNNNRRIKSFKIVGSNTEVNGSWVELYTHSPVIYSLLSGTTDRSLIINFPFNMGYYSFYRLIIMATEANSDGFTWSVEVLFTRYSPPPPDVYFTNNTMTSETTGQWKVNHSSVYTPGLDGFRAFNGIALENWGWLAYLDYTIHPYLTNGEPNPVTTAPVAIEKTTDTGATIHYGEWLNVSSNLNMMSAQSIQFVVTIDNPSRNIRQFKIFGTNNGDWGSPTNGTWELVYDHTTNLTWTQNSSNLKNYSPVIAFPPSFYYRHMRIVITKTHSNVHSNGIIECFFGGSLQAI